LMDSRITERREVILLFAEKGAATRNEAGTCSRVWMITKQQAV